MQKFWLQEMQKTMDTINAKFLNTRKPAAVWIQEIQNLQNEYQLQCAYQK